MSVTTYLGYSYHAGLLDLFLQQIHHFDVKLPVKIKFVFQDLEKLLIYRLTGIWVERFLNLKIRFMRFHDNAISFACLLRDKIV